MIHFVFYIVKENVYAYIHKVCMPFKLLLILISMNFLLYMNKTQTSMYTQSIYSLLDNNQNFEEKNIRGIFLFDYTIKLILF